MKLLCVVVTKGIRRRRTNSVASRAVANYSALKTNQVGGLTQDDLMNLSTGSKEPTTDEMVMSRIGRGFRSYGMGRSGRAGGILVNK